MYGRSADLIKGLVEVRAKGARAGITTHACGLDLGRLPGRVRFPRLLRPFRARSRLRSKGRGDEDGWRPKG
eukprot:4070487-Alexandrium_andersonii.AAC.1